MGISDPGRGCSYVHLGLQCCHGAGVPPLPHHPSLSCQHWAPLCCSPHCLTLALSLLPPGAPVVSLTIFAFLSSYAPSALPTITPWCLHHPYCPLAVHPHLPPRHLLLPVLTAGRPASSSRSWGTSAAGAMASCKSPRSASSARPSSTLPAATVRSSPMGSTGRSSAGTSRRRARSRR